jgi:hypothetical protein
MAIFPLCIFRGCNFFASGHNREMASMMRWLRSNRVVVGTGIIAIAVIFFLVWPLLFGSSGPVVKPVGPVIYPTAPIASGSAPTAGATATTTRVASVRLLVIAGTSTIMDDAVNVASLSQGESTFTLLKNEAAQDGVAFAYRVYPGMGDLITGIGGFTNGTGENYWQYTVNGVYMQVGADEYAPKAGDSIVWKFMKSGE